MFHFLTNLKNLSGKITSFISGEVCIKCGNKLGFFCDDCLNNLHYLNKPYCNICSIPLQSSLKSDLCGNCLTNRPYYKKSFSPFLYDEEIKDVLISAKFNGKFYFLDKLMNIAKPFVESMFDNICPLDLIIPVPMSPKSLLKRGYNQSLLIAKNLSKLSNVQINSNIIFKNKETPAQSSLSRVQRFQNVKGVFSLKNKISIEKALLVDDIITTTATINEISKILIEGGVNEVFVFALCRTKD